MQFLPSIIFFRLFRQNNIIYTALPQRVLAQKTELMSFRTGRL